MKRSIVMRFLRGLGYAIAGSAVAYAMANINAIAALAPRYSFLVPVLTAGLLAADKWLRARNADEQ